MKVSAVISILKKLYPNTYISIDANCGVWSSGSKFLEWKIYVASEIINQAFRSWKELCCFVKGLSKGEASMEDIKKVYGAKKEK